MNMKRMLTAGAAVVALCVAPAALAQQTSATINGVLTDELGAPRAGVTVTIRDERTGATDTAVTTSNGTFFEPGLRVGGPYTITADGVTEQGVFLQPSSNSVRLSDQQAVSEDVLVVTGTVGARLDLDGGVGSVFDVEDILSQPATERDIISTLVRDPLAFSNGEGNISIAGNNPRFNALSIDGSLQGNDFGLGNGLYATNKAPISLDVIETASVAASNYSVETTGFTGGLINVVTKSGTNEFHGSGYYYRQDEDYFGNSAFDSFVSRAAATEEEYGFTVGGPIIKDKLFFFAAYDEYETASGANFTQADIDNDVDPALYDEIQRIVQDVYNYDLGGRPTTVALPETSERLLAKIDWNINADHRASFNYQQTEESSVSGVSSTNFQSAYYTVPIEVTAYGAQLNSDWTPNLSTEFRVNMKELDQQQACNAGSDIGAFSIRLTEAESVVNGVPLIDDGDANPLEDDDNALTITGGCDVFRQGNTFSDERLQVFGKADYQYGNHLITFGGEFEHYELENLFAQFSVGEWRFESLDDLENQVASRITAQRSDTGVRSDIAAAWAYDKIALFAGDRWQVTPDFRLDYGLRYEAYVSNDEPTERTFFEATYGYSNQSNLDGLDIWLPRVGFEYTPFNSTKVTGGFGLFTGGDPKVWTSNAFTPATFREDIRNVAGADPTAGTPQALLDEITANDSNDPGLIDTIAPDFEIPADWRASLRVDQEFDLNFGDKYNFGEGYLASLQVLYSQTQNGFRWENLAQTERADTTPGVAPDGRPVYADLDELDIPDAIELTNYDEGESLIFSAALSKEYENGLGFYVSYAYQDIESVTPGSSSRAISNFRAIFDSDRNNPSAGRAPFEVEHAFKANFSYEDEIFGDLTSRFNLFGQIFSGEPYSYTFDVGSLEVAPDQFENNALFGRSDGGSPFDNDLLYVPTISNGAINDSAVVVASSFQEGDFVDYVGKYGLPTGSIVDRNSDESNWTQRWDFQWQQDLPTPSFGQERLAENQLKFVVDVKNVLNLLNDEWGTEYNAPGNNAQPIVQADLVSVADVTANGVDGATALVGDAPRTTCLSAGDCVYRFKDFDDESSSDPSTGRSVYEIRLGLRYEF